MSGKWLSAIGRAAPAITQTMQEMQERPKQEARWGWEQEQAGQRREAFGQQKALGDIALNKAKAEEETRKEQERLDKAPIPLRTHPFMANFLPEDEEKVIEMGRKIGLVTGEKGSEETTGRGWKYFQQMIGENEQMATWVANAEGRKIQKQANDAFTKYEKVSNDPSATSEDKAKVFKILEVANAAKAGHQKNFDAYISAIKFTNDFKGLQKNPDFAKLPDDKKYQIFKAAEDAMATQDYNQYYKARDKAFEEAKTTTPSWKVVQDPKSSTGYSYQDMNNPTGELRTGAPAPKAAAEIKIDIGGKSFTEMGKKMGERVVEQHKDAEQAIDSLKRLQDAKKLLSSGMITGAGAGYILSVGKVLQQGGISLAPDAIANTEAYAAMMGNQVGQIIKQFGAGTGLSDADREYAEKIAGGKITLTKQSLEKIIDLNEKGLRNAVQNYNKRAKEIMDKPEGKDLPYDLRINVPSGLMGEGGKGLIHYYVGDNEYFIPPEKESVFMKKYPNAKKAR